MRERGNEWRETSSNTDSGRVSKYLHQRTECGGGTAGHMAVADTEDSTFP